MFIGNSNWKMKSKKSAYMNCNLFEQNSASKFYSDSFYLVLAKKMRSHSRRPLHSMMMISVYLWL